MSEKKIINSASESATHFDTKDNPSQTFEMDFEMVRSV